MKSTRFALLMALFVIPVIQTIAAQGDTTTVTVSGTLIEGPQCTINSGRDVTVDFGDDLITRLVDGANYKKEIDYPLTCTGSAANSGAALKVTIRGNAAGFGSGLIATTKTGLGIRLLSGASGNTTLTPGNYVNFSGTANKPRLWAVPVAQNSSTLTAGSFSGTGTMVIDFQ